MSKRNAFTLTELVVSMSAGSALMMMAIGMIHQTMTLASTARSHADNDRCLNRLADQFRHDVHRAQQVTLDSPENIRLEFASASEVTYRINDHGVTRRQAVSAGQRHEVYSLTDQTVVQFGSQVEPTRAILTVQRETGLDGVPPRIQRHISAVVGRLIFHESGKEPSP